MITSVVNQKVKRVVQLNTKPAWRKKESVFVVEGIKMFLEAPEEALQEIYVSEGFLKELEQTGGTGGAGRADAGSRMGEERNGASGLRHMLREEALDKLNRCGYEVVSGEVFAKMSDTRSPQGILCVAGQLRYDLDELVKRADIPLFLVLENLQDPGNLGTIMRTGRAPG